MNLKRVNIMTIQSFQGSLPAGDLHEAFLAGQSPGREWHCQKTVRLGSICPDLNYGSVPVFLTHLTLLTLHTVPYLRYLRSGTSSRIPRLGHAGSGQNAVESRKNPIIHRAEDRHRVQAEVSTVHRISNSLVGPHPPSGWS